MSNRIERIIATEFFPSYRGQEPADYYRAVEEHVAALKRKGATHVMINQGLLSIPMAMQPDNAYYEFCAYGHSLDKFVTSSYNEGLYYEGLLAENRRLLLHNASLAEKHGFRCAIFCVEPAFVTESFFKRHPALRGPRVDNPACSTSPVYALCPMLPEVQDHYRQLIRNLLQLVPEIDEMHIFTNDSGGGVCHSTHLYAGPNGPCHCRKTPPARQAQVFAQALVDAGREINPAFRVVMTSGLSPKEKRDFARNMPPGVASSVYGAFAWGGGLEDRWGTQEAGPRVYNNPAERTRVRQWQAADYEARIRQILAGGGIAYASYNFGYYAGEGPRPYEIHKIVCLLLRWGVTNIIGGGPNASVWSANMAAFRRAAQHGPEPTEAAVSELARNWVGAEVAPALCEAWRLNEHAASEWPHPPGGHLLFWWPSLRYLPIVPHEERLKPGDLDYCQASLQTYDRKMKEQSGGVWRLLHYADGLTPKYLAQYERVTFPTLEKAIGILEDVLARPGLTPEQRTCLEEQVGSIRQVLRDGKHVYHWLAASLHRIEGLRPPAGAPTLRDIIRAEIELGEKAARAVGSEPADHPRLQLMREHLDDPPRRVDLSEFPPSAHPAMDTWEGAHLIRD
jgi:hypothetical protein